MGVAKVLVANCSCLIRGWADVWSHAALTPIIAHLRYRQHTQIWNLTVSKLIGSLFTSSQLLGTLPR